MLTPENAAWKDVVGNLYQDILGDKEFKVRVIREWLTLIRASNCPEDRTLDEDTEYKVRMILATFYERMV